MATSIRMEDAIEEWENSMRSKGISPSTIKTRRTRLRALYTITGNIFLKNLTSNHFDKVFEAHVEWAPATKVNVVGAYTAFLKWAANKRYVERYADPLHEWRRIVIPQKHRLRLEPVRFTELLDSAPNARDRMMLSVLLYLLLRQSEARRLQWRDVKLAGPMDSMVKIVRPKTKEVDEIAMSSELYEEFQRWRNLYCRDQGVTTPQPDWYVLCQRAPGYTGRTEKGLYVRDQEKLLLVPDKPLGRLEHLVQKPLQAMGLEIKQEGAHTLRRSGARAMFDYLCEEKAIDDSLLIVQAMLGHKDVRTTQHYLGLVRDRLKRNKVLAGQSMYGQVNRDAKIIPLGSVSR